MKTRMTFPIHALTMAGVLGLANAWSLTLRPGFENYNGPFEMKLVGWVNASLYPPLAVGGTYGSEDSVAGVPMCDAALAIPAVGGHGGPGWASWAIGTSEDTWGVAIVTEIRSPDSSLLWREGDNGEQLTAIYYGSEDFNIEQVSPAEQFFDGVGMRIDVYLDRPGQPGGTAAKPVSGSLGRTGLASYATFTDGELILTTVSVPGFLHFPGTLGGIESTFMARFDSLSLAGFGTSYLAVTGGSMAAAFDFDGYNPLLPGFPNADIWIQFTTTASPVGPDPGASGGLDWLQICNDPVRGRLTSRAVLGDRVWLDANGNGLQDEGEPGLEGVDVRLFDGDGNFFDSMTTGANGIYAFTVVPGDYYVQFMLPNGFLFTLVGQGDDNTIDSDAELGDGTTTIVDLGMGEINLTLDAGLIPPTPALDLEKSTNGHDADIPTGPVLALGAAVVWEYVVTNTGEVPLTNIVVADDQLGLIGVIAALAPGESTALQANGVAVVGQYANLGTASATYTDGLGNSTDVQDSDPSHYLVEETNDCIGTGTQGYWKTHPNAWPVDSIGIAGIVYAKAQAIALINTPPRNDKTYSMFQQLVAAKLNLMIGNEDSCIAATIALADAWMAVHPVGSGVSAKSGAWNEGGPWHQMLDDYNNGLLCAPSRDLCEDNGDDKDNKDDNRGGKNGKKGRN